MTKITEIKTARLLLRQWRQQDLSCFADMNADTEVMRHYPSTLSVNESSNMAEKCKSLIATRGWGFWAVETLLDKSFIGFVGLHEPGYQMPVMPCVEIGWRLAREYWGKGYATEAARASLDFAFRELKLREVYSFTSVTNTRSRAVMERLAMLDTMANFNHPMIPANSPLREHVMYKTDRRRWLQKNT